jgi:DNA repair exonuclease SbcCD nuclease subunit
MVRFIHTSDWQIGASFTWAGPRSQRLAEARLEAAKAVVAAAIEQQVDFVLVAGDTFEDHDVEDALVRRVVEILGAAAPIPIHVLPGNHDPLAPGAVWERTSWRSRPAHIHLCTERRPIHVSGDVELLACPLKQKVSREDPTAWLAATQAAPGTPRSSAGKDAPRTAIRIGLAHGALDVLGVHSNFPISARAAERYQLDYLALGDWHGRREFGRAVYSGTIEPTNFDEQGAGQALLVQIDGPGEPARLTALPTRILTWHSLDETIADETDVACVETQLAALGALEQAVLRVRLKVEPGLPEAQLAVLEALEATLRVRVCALDWALDVEALLPAYDAAIIADSLLSRVDEALASIAAAEQRRDLPAELAGADPAAARGARALLHRYLRRSGA